jgi:hypothetical protein
VVVLEGPTFFSLTSGATRLKSPVADGGSQQLRAEGEDETEMKSKGVQEDSTTKTTYGATPHNY